MYTIHYPKEIIPLIMELFVITRYVVELITSDTKYIKGIFYKMMRFHNLSCKYCIRIIPQQGIEITQLFSNNMISSTLFTRIFNICFYTETKLDIVIDLPTINSKIQKFNDDDPLTLCVRNNNKNRLEIYSGIE